MKFEIRDHGVWETYTPDTIPRDIPRGAIFMRNAAGVDWYAYRRTRGTWAEDSVVACGQDQDDGHTRIFTASWDPSAMLVLDGLRIVEVLQFPLDSDPRGTLAGLVLDRAAGEFSPHVPHVTTVAAVQAKIQLSRTSHQGTDLLTATEQLVAAGKDRELQLWFAGALTWRLDNPNVQKIGAVFELSPETVQRLFDEASKINA